MRVHGGVAHSLLTPLKNMLLNDIKTTNLLDQMVIVRELFKYGGKTVHETLLTLFNSVWNNTHVPSYWREGLIVNSFEIGDREDPGNYRGITLLNLISELYSGITNNCLLKYLHVELNDKVYEGQGGFRIGCM